MLDSASPAVPSLDIVSASPARGVLRVAIVGDWYAPRRGGIETQTHELARRLMARGHRVTVITSTPGPAVVDGVAVRRLDGPRLPGFGIAFSPGAFRRLAGLLRDGRFDVVHVHFGIVAPVAYAAVRCAHRLALPLVATFHSVLRGWSLPLRVLRGVLGAHEWRVAWTGVSRLVAETLRPLAGTAPVGVLPNAVDAAWWARGTTAGPVRDAGAPITVVAVMRLYARKRPLAFVRAIAAVVRRLPDAARVRVCIVGSGPQHALVASLVKRLGLDGPIELLGWRSREDVRALLHAADAFVLPSRLEAFGIAALEARAAGVPVIAMREGGAGEFLRDGDDALLVDDDRAMADALYRIVTDAPLRARLQAGAGAALPPALGWVAALDAHEAAYRRAIAMRTRVAAPSGRPVAPSLA